MPTATAMPTAVSATSLNSASYNSYSSYNSTSFANNIVPSRSFNAANHSSASATTVQSVTKVISSHPQLRSVMSLEVPMGGSGSQTYSNAYARLRSTAKREISESDYLRCFLPHSEHPSMFLEEEDEDKRILHNSFLAFDLTGSGTISFRDCQALLWELDGVCASEDVLQELVYDASARPHAVTFDEFCDWRASQQHIACHQSRIKYVGGLRQKVLDGIRPVFHRLHRYAASCLPITRARLTLPPFPGQTSGAINLQQWTKHHSLLSARNRARGTYCRPG